MFCQSTDHIQGVNLATALASIRYLRLLAVHVLKLTEQVRVAER
jgi:hypothetical protein